MSPLDFREVLHLLCSSQQVAAEDLSALDVVFYATMEVSLRINVLVFNL